MGKVVEEEKEGNTQAFRPPAHPVFSGVEGWLTPDGVESLEVCFHSILLTIIIIIIINSHNLTMKIIQQ